MAYYSKKMILAKTQYETNDNVFLAIIKTFKTWQHYDEDCKHEVLRLTDHNNLYYFMDIKNLSAKQVSWTQKLFCYYF